MPNDFDIEANRASRKWTRTELLGRVLWAAVTPAFRLSPRLCWGWRATLLRLFGAKIGRNVHIHPSVTIFVPWNLVVKENSSIGFEALIYNLGEIEIGSNSTISQRAHLCAGTHDYRDPAMPLMKPPIRIGSSVWVCADSFIGPGVSIGDRAIVGARAVVLKDAPSGTIVGGNPSRVLKKRDPPSDA
ncbi:MAG: hypothetical protein U0892_21260 [Pirellulales bacterium]